MKAIAARDVLGRHATRLSDVDTAGRRTLPRAFAAAERWFGSMLGRRGGTEGIDRCGIAPVVGDRRTGPDRVIYAGRAGLSARHFRRKFSAQIGLSPKLFARTIRFDAALSAHRREPAKRGPQIVHEAGYFDQAHFVRECHCAGRGMAPSELIGDWDNIFSLEMSEHRAPR